MPFPLFYANSLLSRCMSHRPLWLCRIPRTTGCGAGCCCPGGYGRPYLGYSFYFFEDLWSSLASKEPSFICLFLIQWPSTVVVRSITSSMVLILFVKTWAWSVVKAHPCHSCAMVMPQPRGCHGSSFQYFSSIYAIKHSIYSSTLIQLS